MTLIDVPITYYPVTLAGSSGIGGALTSDTSHSLLDAAGEKLAFVFRAPKTGTIDRISFRTATVTTGDATGLDVRLETLDTATGDPTGTLVKADAPASNVLVPILDTDDTTWFEGVLAGGGSVTQGVYYSAVVEAPVGYAGTILLAYCANLSIGPYVPGECYIDYYTSGAWVKKAAHLQRPLFRIRYSDETYPYIPNLCTAESLGEYTISTDTTPDEIGTKPTVPKARAMGYWVNAELDVDSSVVLYDTDGSTALGTVAMDASIVLAGDHRVHTHRWPSAVTLTTGTGHRVVWKPTTATSTARLAYAAFAAAAHKEQMGLSLVQKTSRSDAGAWTEDPLEVPFIGLVMDQFDDGAGGGASAGGSPLQGLVA